MSDITLDRVGLVVLSGVNQSGFYGGLSSNGASGSPTITDNGYGPDQLPYFNTEDPYIAFWGNNTTVTYSSIVVDNSSVDFGKWDNLSDPTAIVQIDPNGDVSESSIYEPIYWITAQQTPSSFVDNQTGTFNSSTLVATGMMGTTFTGTLSSANFNLSLDFNTGDVTGSMAFTSSPDSWDLQFAGFMSGNVLDVNINETTSTVSYGAGPKSVTGDIPMVFIGDTASGIVGAFDVQEVGNQDVHAEGVFVIDLAQ